MRYRHYCCDLFQEICSNPQLFVDGANRMDVIQGILGMFGCHVCTVCIVLYCIYTFIQRFQQYTLIRSASSARDPERRELFSVWCCFEYVLVIVQGKEYILEEWILWLKLCTDFTFKHRWHPKIKKLFLRQILVSFYT